MFDEVTQQNAELSEDVESKKEEIAKLEEQLLTLSKDKIISDLSEGLVDTQKAKFKKLTSDIAFESAEQFTEKAQIVRESYFSQKKEEVQEEPKSENKVTTTEVVIEEVKDKSDGLSPLMSRYINASSKLEKDAF
jgi:FKBP-type peptidyl-prolyl cis-trans isomerase